ncbi:MAG: type II toxin-antitoxin system VapC family toxin [Candidatus Erginobacter occultus]|nr:type II toxin-antitoxin system VapC family toxin [Candidatus Erginobacter occultus]
MILVDANILLYAENELSPFNTPARLWWDDQLSSTSPVCLCWPVVNAFIRVGTNQRIFQRPLSLEESLSRVQSWLDQPCVRMIRPTERHWTVFQKMLRDGQASANLVSDAHLAALAVEHGCELATTDSDFSRFPGLRWGNPLR